MSRYWSWIDKQRGPRPANRPHYDAAIPMLYGRSAPPAFTPASLSGLVQRFLDANPSYYGSTLNSYPIITPEEPGTVAVPRAGRCWTFDGANDYAVATRVMSGAVTTATVVAWFKTTSLSFMCIASEWNDASNRSYLLMLSSGRVVVYTSPDGLYNANRKEYQTNSTYNDGSWHQVAFTWDNGSLKIYVDAVEVAVTKNVDGSGAVLYSTTASFVVGGYLNPTISAPFNGSLSDVRVYNVAKSPAEIAAIYNQSLTPNTIDTTGLLAHYPCAEESGTTGYDCSGNGRHLTLTNITQATFHAADIGVRWSLPNQKCYTLANNLLTYSEQFDNAAWVKSNSTVTANSIAAPNGASTADSLTENTSNSIHSLDTSITSVSGSVYAGSVYLKQGTRGFAFLCLATGAGTQTRYTNVINLSTGVITDTTTQTANGVPALTSVTVTDAGNGWWRVVMTIQSNSSGPLYLISGLSDSAAPTYSNAIPTYLGTSSTIYVWGAQIELGTTATTYAATTASTLSNVVIPASLSTPSQDAAGNALGVTGPVAYPATMEVPCVTGDGSAVHATTTLAVGSTLTFCAWVRFATTGTQAIFAPNGSAGNGVLLRYNGTTTIQWFSNTGSTVQDITVPSLVGSWNHIAITHTGSTYAFYLNGSLVASGTLGPLWVAGNELTIGRYSSSGGINYLNGSIADVRVYSDVKTLAEIQAIRSGADNRANLLAHWPIQEGPGTSNTNRTSYDTVGSNNLTWTNGTVSAIWANRCPFVRDWCINYGGGIAANGSFVPGRIGSANDAAGNAKTLSAGKHGNPYSRLCPNPWAAPALVNIGYTASSKLAPITNPVDTAPANTKFRRYSTPGSDRYFAVNAALTSTDLTNAVNYTSVASTGDIRASVGTSTSPTSTGTKAVTGVGFTPKVVLPWTVAMDVVGPSTGAPLWMGCGLSSSNRAAITVNSTNAVTTSNTSRRHDNTKVIGFLAGSGADLSSMDAGGFTFDWLAALAADARILNHIALGGADLEVSLVQCQMNGTNAAQSFAHGLSGAPTGVLFFGGSESTVPPITSTGLLATIGAWAGSNQFCAAVYSNSGVTTTTTRRALFTTCVNSHMGTSALRSMAVSSVDGTNVNMTYPVTTIANTNYFFMLAIRGAKCQVGTFDANGAAVTIATTGITPKLFLPVFVPNGAGFLGTVLSDIMLSIGACDGTNNVSCGITDQNGVTTTNARRFQSSTSLCEYSTAGTKSFEATAAFVNESVVMTPTTSASNGFGEGAYLIIGS